MQLSRLLSAFITFVLFFFQLESSPAKTFEVPTSFRQPHPMNWLHSTPVGETPGWNNEKWFFFELSNSNIWNAPLTMTNTKNGDTYVYEADYEQVTAIAEVGTAVTKKLALALELPFAYRNGGFLDNIIEDAHDIVGTRNFNREFYSQNRRRFSTSTNGNKGYTNANLSHFSSVKTKLKWWAKKCRDQKTSTCGLSLSTQLKLPLESSNQGGTNDKIEGSVLLHAGRSFFKGFNAWATAGFSRLRRDDNMPGWPLLKNHQMFELNFDYALNNKWGAFLTFRTQSPFLDRNQLTYEDSETDARLRSNNRAATGWNSLVRWQGAEAIGIRYRKKNRQMSFAFSEDWGLGSYDASSHIYSNNAPDVNFIFQASWGY